MLTCYLLFTRYKVESSSVTDDEITYTCTPKYEFFGYTFDKNILKEFKKIRDMDKFVVVKEHIHSDDKKEVIKNIRKNHKEKELGLFRFKTKGGKSVEIVSHEDEHGWCDTSENMGIMDTLIDSTYDTPSDIFNSKYRDALNLIGYDMFHSYAVDGEELNICFDCDELSTLLGMYGELFKVRGDES